MLRYHVAFYLPRRAGEMVVAEALDFPGAASQGFDLPDARLMIASAVEDLAQGLLDDGNPLPVPNPEAVADEELRGGFPPGRRCPAKQPPHSCASQPPACYCYRGILPFGIHGLACTDRPYAGVPYLNSR